MSQVLCALNLWLNFRILKLAISVQNLAINLKNLGSLQVMQKVWKAVIASGFEKTAWQSILQKAVEFAIIENDF